MTGIWWKKQLTHHAENLLHGLTACKWLHHKTTQEFTGLSDENETYVITKLAASIVHNEYEEQHFSKDFSEP